MTNTIRPGSPDKLEVVEASEEGQYLVARELIEEYARTLAVDLCFQGFNEEIVNLRALYGPPSGCLLLARLGGDVVRVIAVRAHKEQTCELKRLYVKGQHRGLGAGRVLAQAALVRARA